MLFRSDFRGRSAANEVGDGGVVRGHVISGARFLRGKRCGERTPAVAQEGWFNSTIPHNQNEASIPRLSPASRSSARPATDSIAPSGAAQLVRTGDKPPAQYQVAPGNDVLVVLSRAGWPPVSMAASMVAPEDAMPRHSFACARASCSQRLWAGLQGGARAKPLADQADGTGRRSPRTGSAAAHTLPWARP